MAKYVVMHGDTAIRVVSPDAPDQQRTLTAEFHTGRIVEAANPMAAVESYLNDQGAHWEKSLQERSREITYVSILGEQI